MSGPRRIDQFTRAKFGRSVSHLTPRYLLDRARAWANEVRDPAAPWLTADAVAVLRTALRAHDRGLEWGSGRSTAWLSRRTGGLVSVEHSAEWLRQVEIDLKRRRIANVDQRYAAVAVAEGDPAAAAVYIAAAGNLEPESLDFVLVDGLYRAECTRRALVLLKPGGLLILDNAERYVPRASRSPEALGKIAQPAAEWSDVLERLADWRLIWTSNGVTDTAIWIRAL
jgi:predicted O-methyltransferase YrrM